MIKNNKQLYIYSFLITAMVALILYFPLVVLDKGIMVYFGDFNCQPLVFTKLCVEAVHNGNFGWNWYTDLGANFIGSYNNYLGSPFFWIFTLFPAEFSHYLIFPVLVLKCGTMGLFASVYMKRFTKTYDAALIGGLMYVLSGYSIYNTVFYQFHDAMAFFPLLLIGLEEAVINKRRGVFALTVALNAIVNYFTFISSCIFLVIYFVSRLIGSNKFRINMKDFLCLAFESVAGVMLAGILFVPSIAQVLDNPRIANILTGTEFFIHNPSERYGIIIQSMLYPPEIPLSLNIFKESKASWSSLTLYMPLFSMAGVFAFMREKKKSWISVAIKIIMLFIFIPALNATFIMMNYMFYFRWIYMAHIILSLATVCALERDDDKYLKYGNKLCAVLTCIFTAFVLFHPVKDIIETENEAGKLIQKNEYHLALEDYSLPTFIIIGIALVSIVIYGLLIKSKKKLPKEKFFSHIMLGTVVMGLVVGYVHLIQGRTYGPVLGTMKTTLNRKIDFEDDGFYRIEVNATGINVNLSMMWNEYSTQSFHTTLPKSIFDIYEKLGKTRYGSVTYVSENLYALRSYLGSKYYAVPDNDFTDVFMEVDKKIDNIKTFEYYKTQSDYDIYRNTLCLPIAFTYDKYVDNITFEKLIPENKNEERPYTDNLIIGSVLLDEKQIEKFSDILTPLEAEKSTVESLTYERFEEEARERISSEVKGYEIYKNGNFRLDTDYAEDELVVTNIPYDKGWSAFINGKPAEVECVNVGFIGIRVPAGENSVEFKYVAPGLKLGIVFSISSMVMVGIYCLYHYKLKKKEN